MLEMALWCVGVFDNSRATRSPVPMQARMRNAHGYQFSHICPFYSGLNRYAIWRTSFVLRLFSIE